MHAGFHNASLYEALRPSIGPLVGLLRGEEEDKTRANAAGALGNLVRNSSQLCGELIRVRHHPTLLSSSLSICEQKGQGTFSVEAGTKFILHTPTPSPLVPRRVLCVLCWTLPPRGSSRLHMAIAMLMSARLSRWPCSHWATCVHTKSAVRVCWPWTSGTASAGGVPLFLGAT